MTKTAYYTFSGGSNISKCYLDIIIPKKKQDGFLKSCFGWHSANEASAIFEDMRPQWFTTGDCSDIDGYLSIELRIHPWEDRFSDGLKEVFDALQKCFPYITQFKEDRELFYKILINQ